MNEIAYLNGSFLPLAEAKIPVMDYGFLFGYGLYETTRVYAGKFFRLDAHLQRLEKSAAALSLPVDIPRFKDVILETASRNPFENGRMRLTVTLGPGAAAPDPRTCHSPTVLCTVVQYQPFPPETYARGYTAIIFNLRRNSQSLLPSMKSSSFVESILAKQKARAMGVDESLMLNDKGRLAEASSSNVFIVSCGKLMSPKMGSGFLPGITRQVIIDLALNLGISHQELDISPGRLASADELFLTNSMIEIMPVTRLDGQAVGSGRPGETTQKLIIAYRELLKKELTQVGA
jgi:branched-chain amino acid aminotransferase